MERSDILKILRQHLTKERYEHSLRVATEAKKLARIHQYDETIAEQAALLHDIAKDHSTKQLKDLIVKYELSDQLLREPEVLWHGPVGAMFVKHKYKLTNKDIFNAIYYHTTAREQMSTLELIIYIADYIEPNRNIPNVIDVRKKSKEDLHQAALLIVSRTIIYLTKRQVPISPRTILAYNDLINYKR